jgi:hypothetical protein
MKGFTARDVYTAGCVQKVASLVDAALGVEGGSSINGPVVVVGSSGETVGGEES